MHEILTSLPPGSRVLDLGSGRGSFPTAPAGVTVIRADLERPSAAPRGFVACSAAHLPFADGTFDALILNHSLEHFEQLERSVGEIARVIARDGLLYVAIPDASTFTDRLYRWLGRGGGHVNLFTDPFAVARMFSEATGLRHAGTRVLCTSLSFLNRRTMTARPPRKLLLLCNGSEGFVRLLTFGLRCMDRVFHSSLCVYGWAFYFGDRLIVDTTIWSNVCVRCGSGEASEVLQEARGMGRPLWPAAYQCRRCGTRNLFTNDEAFRYLREGLERRTA